MAIVLECVRGVGVQHRWLPFCQLVYLNLPGSF